MADWELGDWELGGFLPWFVSSRTTIIPVREDTNHGRRYCLRLSVFTVNFYREVSP